MALYLPGLWRSQRNNRPDANKRIDLVMLDDRSLAIHS